MQTWQRALAVVAAGSAMVLGASTPAQAAPQSSITVFNAGITCVGATTTGERAFVSFGTSDDFGDSAYVAVGPEESPMLEAFGGGSGWNGGSPSFELDVYNANMEFVGTGSLTGTVSVRSETETTTRDGSGNQRVRAHIVAATLDATVDLTLPGVRIAVLDCSGSQTTTTYVGNQPASTVRFERFLYDNVECSGNAVVGVFGPEEGTYFVSVDVVHNGQQYNLFGAVDNPRGTFTVVLALKNSDTGEEVGRFPVTITLEATGPTTTHVLRTSTARVTQAWTPYQATGTVKLPWGTYSATCKHLEVTVREIIRAAQGPKPGGTPPANDTLAGAARLALGDTVRTTTRAAGVGAEEGMSCVDAPVGRTLWYSFVGTGEPVRLDTAGSSFDTALAVYRSTDRGLREVACADNLDQDYPLPTASLQAALEMDTVRGVTYRVQVGGVFADFGRLALTLTPAQG
jgi:hypothetical protein